MYASSLSEALLSSSESQPSSSSKFSIASRTACLPPRGAYVFCLLKAPILVYLCALGVAAFGFSSRSSEADGPLIVGMAFFLNGFLSINAGFYYFYEDFVLIFGFTTLRLSRSTDPEFLCLLLPPISSSWVLAYLFDFSAAFLPSSL